MPLVNFTTREITCKLVYYGPGRCGKTTNLLYIHGRVPEDRRGNMVSLATQSDRTLFFDFLPIELGQISGFTTRFQLYTVPGQVYYNATRRLVLQGADGVVFVVDSQARRFDDNLESFQNLQENLLEQGVDIRQLPLVLQYNKQDLPPDLVLAPPDLDDAFNFRGVPSHPADALHGAGVFETLKALSALVLQRLASPASPTVTVVLSAAPDFETFVLDAANRPAAAAARAAADASGVPYAPLVVLGPPGSGKSELLHAIAGRVRAQHPSAVIEHLDPDGLAERYRSALLVARGEMCRAEIQAADLVLIDDFERLSRHQDCQGLVADLLDGRRGAGREMVVATSVPVERLTGLDARLLRRLAEGTTVHLSLPGPEARYAILRRRLQGQETALLDEVIRAVAEAEFESMRDYTGALSRLVVFQEASALPLSPRDALMLIGAPVAPVPQTDEAPLVLHGADEFGAFLSEVSAGLSEQVDRWRRRIGEAVLRWGGEGLRTRRLEALLADESPGDPEAILAAYDADAAEIMALGARAAQLAPDLAGAEVFRDPDQLPAARALVAQAESRSAPLTAPLAHYRWEDFAEGPSMRLPMMAARDIIAEPGRRYSPLVVIGASGTGKTHYLHALGNALAAGGVAPVACLGGHAYAAEVRTLADADALASWRHHYRWVGAFLLDDLHLLAGDRAAQEELILLIGELTEGGRQMVLTTSQPLEELEGLDARLLARLGGGLAVELPSPDREVRLAVVKRMLTATSAAGDAALADFLAARPADSVRAVQGMVQRVLGESAAQNVEPSPALAREVLDVMDIAMSRGARRPDPRRGSGILTPGMGQVRSPEKTVMHWPSAADRLLAELR